MRRVAARVCVIRGRLRLLGGPKAKGGSERPRGTE